MQYYQEYMKDVQHKNGEQDHTCINLTLIDCINAVQEKFPLVKLQSDRVLTYYYTDEGVEDFSFRTLKALYRSCRATDEIHITLETSGDGKTLYLVLRSKANEVLEETAYNLCDIPSLDYVRDVDNRKRAIQAIKQTILLLDRINKALQLNWNS